MAGRCGVAVVTESGTMFMNPIGGRGPRGYVLVEQGIVRCGTAGLSARAAYTWSAVVVGSSWHVDSSWYVGTLSCLAGSGGGGQGTGVEGGGAAFPTRACRQGEQEGSGDIECGVTRKTGGDDDRSTM